ncbi:hypothetical protein EYF80_012206 [Liparis tanakae]|uniref:Uncharacterized protein n=1 Tax=Liparis tanakae TaxID=230148 RepID=A0A4Z2II58_9TELE|nr:hypothetical protein EYF80_012206 [Liparis tanakae]
MDLKPNELLNNRGGGEAATPCLTWPVAYKCGLCPSDADQRWMLSASGAPPSQDPTGDPLVPQEYIVYARVLQQRLQGVVPSDSTGWEINQAREMEASAMPTHGAQIGRKRIDCEDFPKRKITFNFDTSLNSGLWERGVKLRHRGQLAGEREGSEDAAAAAAAAMAHFHLRRRAGAPRRR